jgi:CDP-paratose 2-epimerase
MNTPSYRINGRSLFLGNGRTPSLTRPILITGGAGFIGTNLAASFLSEGQPVLILDNLSRPGVSRNLDWLIRTYAPLVRVVEADVTDPPAVGAAVGQASCIFHLAAQVAVTTSLLEPRNDFEVNAGGTLNVLEACRALASPPPLLFTSTNKVYGSLENVVLEQAGDRYQPLDEAMRLRGVDERQPLDLHSPYGCSKGAADQYVLDYSKCFDLPAVVFRMSCIYGPHQHGTEDQGWAAHFVKQILGGKPIMIYGDGCQVRDMLFAGDLVRAMRTAVERIDATRGRAFNIGGGPANAVSVGEVVQHLGRLHGIRPSVHYGEWRPGDQRYYVSNTQLFEQFTGWKPEVDVQGGLSLLYKWLQKASLENRSRSERRERSLVNGHRRTREPRAKQTVPSP